MQTQHITNLINFYSYNTLSTFSYKYYRDRSEWTCKFSPYIIITTILLCKYYLHLLQERADNWKMFSVAEHKLLKSEVGCYIISAARYYSPNIIHSNAQGYFPASMHAILLLDPPSPTKGTGRNQVNDLGNSGHISQNSASLDYSLFKPRQVPTVPIHRGITMSVGQEWGSLSHCS